MARAAEEVGFDSVWLGDHMLYRDDGRPERGPWDVWTLLAGLAAATERVALGPLVACTAFHPPGVLARMAAAVDEISGGRLVVALGAGWNEAEFRAFDVPFDSRVSRFAEAFEIIRRLLAGERVTIEGRFHHLQDAVVLPRPRRRPPLMVGTTGPRMLALTLPHVDAWNSWYDWYGNTPEGFSAGNQEITRAARECGRDPAEIERSACVLVARGDPKERPAEGDAAAVRAADAAEHLQALAEAGANEAILVLDPIDEESIRALRPVLAGL
jgi:alkanesulfonate monooxygenase SsuD/methylene tetrahydromethanopterin reductase-like flavin-dependent oxidoreductase (luciferase family)